MNSKSLIPVRIGALLVAAEIVKAKDLVDALKQARIKGVPLGETLVELQLITQDLLNSAIDAQKLLRDGSISIETAQLALKMSASNNLLLSEALDVLGWRHECFNHQNMNKLERLLLVSEIVNKAQLDQAIWNSTKSGLPIGRILVLMGITSPSLLLSALHALLLIRHNQINFEEAAQGLKYAANTGVSLDEALSIEPSELIELGELLTSSSVVSTSDIAHAIELGLVNQQPMVHVLIQSGLANEEIVEAAIKLQKKIRHGELSMLQAAEMLRRVDSQGVSVDALLGKSSAVKEAVIALLKKAYIIDDDDIDKSLELHPEHRENKIEALCQSSAISEGQVRAALRSAMAMFDGHINIIQAVETIKSFQENKHKKTAQLNIEESSSHADSNVTQAPIADLLEQTA